MKNHHIMHFVALSCFCCLPNVGGTQEGGLSNKKITNLDTVKQSYHIILKTGSMNVPNVLSEQWYGNGCAHGQEKVNSVDHIVLMRVFDKSGKELKCPTSAWSDLGNIYEFYVVPQKEGCKIVIGGGDGGVAYEAVFWFSGRALIKRRVSDSVGNNSDSDSFEVTTYHLK